MAGFWRALSNAGPAAFKGYEDTERYLDDRKTRRTQGEAAGAYGKTLGGLFGDKPPPLPQTSGGGGMPTAMAGVGNAAYPMPPMPGQSPTAPPPPNQPPPGTPEMQGAPAPPPMPQGPPQNNVMPFPRPKPMGDSMPSSGSMAPAPAMAPQGGGDQGPYGGINLKDLVDGIKRNAPGISPEALGMAIDRFTPMLNQQGQYEARQLRLQMDQMKQEQLNNWRGEQGQRADRRLDQGDQHLSDVNARFDQRMSFMQEKEARIKSMKLPPEQAYQQKYLSQRLGTAASAARAAHTDLTRLQASGGGDEVTLGQAQEAYTRADALRWDAQQEYERFLDTVTGGAHGGAPPGPSNSAPGGTPQAVPSPAPAAKPVGKITPIGPQSLNNPAAFGAQPSGTGGPLLAETAGVVGPVRGRPADADKWDFPAGTPGHPRSGTFPNSFGPGPDNAEQLSAPDNAPPPMFAPRSEGDKPAPVPGDSAVDVANSAAGDYENIHQTLAQLKAAHAALSQTMAQTPEFRRNQRLPTQVNADATAQENKAMPGGHMSMKLENIGRHIKEIQDWLDEFTHPDEVSRQGTNYKAKPKQPAYGAGRGA